MSQPTQLEPQEQFNQDLESKETTRSIIYTSIIEDRLGLDEGLIWQEDTLKILVH